MLLHQDKVIRRIYLPWRTGLTTFLYKIWPRLVNMETGLTNAGLDFIEEGRRNIFEWGEKRRSNRRGLKGRIYEITKLFIDRSVSVLPCFTHIFNDLCYLI